MHPATSESRRQRHERIPTRKDVPLADLQISYKSHAAVVAAMHAGETIPNLESTMPNGTMIKVPGDINKREYVAFNKTLYEKPEFVWLSHQRNRVASIHFAEAQAAAQEVLAGWHRNGKHERKLHDADKKLAPWGSSYDSGVLASYRVSPCVTVCVVVN
jgi:hypothetical protein